jgi:hypothetical protein
MKMIAPTVASISCKVKKLMFGKEQKRQLILRSITIANKNSNRTSSDIIGMPHVEKAGASSQTFRNITHHDYGYNLPGRAITL